MTKKTPAAPVPPVARFETLNEAMEIAAANALTALEQTSTAPTETLNEAIAGSIEAMVKPPEYAAPDPVLTVGAGSAQTGETGEPMTEVEAGTPIEGGEGLPTINIPAPYRRVITEHHTNALNRGLSITVCDAPGVGGASHLYLIEGFEPFENPAANALLDSPGPGGAFILFQNGPALEGANGLTHEVLLAVVIDRLRSFQAGQFACPENASALLHCQAALGALGRRSAGRAARGVEGTHTV